MTASSFAVFSDIHSNLEALAAVLEDIATHGVRRMVCLGDIVGYAANPGKCVNRIRKLGCAVIRGNHDEAASGNCSLEDMRDVAKTGIEFSRRKLTPAQREWLAGLPIAATDGQCEFVHASLYNPSSWPYIFGAEDAMEHFTVQRCRIAFCGHTHVPMVAHLNGTGNLRFARGRGRVPLFPGGKTLVNVGSVGQPRDGQPQACYVLCDPDADTVEFRRVDYDIARTRRKIMRAKLPRALAERLARGE